LILPGIAGSLVFTYLAVRDVDGDVFWESLRRSHYEWLVPALTVLAAAVFLRALRWRLLFPRATRPAVGPITRALLVGYLFDNILPMRAGEAARVVVLHRETGGSRAEAAGTLVTERLYDVLSCSRRHRSCRRSTGCAEGPSSASAWPSLPRPWRSPRATTRAC
jgi:uncharacterized membrane protein YbhN (UPF0104 family)